jgi:hypothetical protein
MPLFTASSKKTKMRETQKANYPDDPECLRDLEATDPNLFSHWNAL